jgi:hypothetical protein
MRLWSKRMHAMAAWWSERSHAGSRPWIDSRKAARKDEMLMSSERKVCSDECVEVHVSAGNVEILIVCVYVMQCALFITPAASNSSNSPQRQLKPKPAPGPATAPAPAAAATADGGVLRSVRAPPPPRPLLLPPPGRTPAPRPPARRRPGPPPWDESCRRPRRQ